MKINLLSFGGGEDSFRLAARQLQCQAVNSGLFNNIFVQTDRLFHFDIRFPKNVKKFVKKNEKGFGLWIWKPYLINKYLDKIEKDEILIYLDAGCRLNFSTKNARSRFHEYVMLAYEHTSIAGQLKDGEWGQKDLSESAWTKSKVIESLELSRDKVTSNQIQAGWQLYRKTDKNVEFVKLWLDLCTKNDFELIRDALPDEKNYPNFIEHRHDQSIFSCLYKKYEKFTIPDDTWWDPDWDTLGSNYPIWAMRAQRKLEYEASKQKTKISFD